jgi:hypothetical protein
LIATALVARGLHQDFNVIKAMSLNELFTWAKIAASLEGRTFT